MKTGDIEVTLCQASTEELTQYAEVSIGFVVDRVLVAEVADVPLRLREIACAQPFLKDYDAEPANRPTAWSERFDVSSWSIVSAWRGGQRIGGAVVVQGSDEVQMLEGRADLAVIWDLRVRPEDRGRGVGSILLQVIETWARGRGFAELKVETQNINVPACRFYEHLGFELRAVNVGAYDDLPHEVQLLWYKDLT